MEWKGECRRCLCPGPDRGTGGLRSGHDQAHRPKPVPGPAQPMGGVVVLQPPPLLEAGGPGRRGGTLRLYLVRHGETDWNKEGRVQGRSDQQLSTLGLCQAELLGEALRAAPIAAVYSSPLRRAWETAEGIARFHSLSVEPEEGLVEMDH